MKAIYAIAYIEAWKSQDFNQVWTCDLVIPVRRSNQLSYEDTDIASWSFVYRKEWMWSFTWNISYIELQIWNEVIYYARSYESNYCDCVYWSLKKSGP